MAGQQQQMQPKRTTMEAAKEPSMDAVLMAAAASVLLSWYQFFARGDREMGIFVGLWPPTILAFASYFNNKRMEEKMEAMQPSNLMSSINQMLGNR